ncbi:MAG: cytochrome c5 family protein [Burkholderiaceae bacterium]|nr:cytochrome c5 family protein [Burkholderiaceae bacterium]
MSDQGNSLIRTPRQLLTVIVLAFVVPVILIILLATYVVRSATSGVSGSDAMSEKAIGERMRQVGVVAFGDSGASKTLQSGEAVYSSSCSACHSAGLAGAPRTGDTAAWAPRLKSGFDLLVRHAVEGFKAMPPKGGNSNLDPIEVARAVAFMANQSGGKFKEPAAPAGAPVAATPAVAASVGAAPMTAVAPASTSGTAAATATKVAASSAPVDGAKVFAAGCNVCHTPGIAGAPKLGDKAAWAPRLGQGVDGLTAAVIKGKGAMPPRGAVANASDADLRAAVVYMVATVK